MLNVQRRALGARPGAPPLSLPNVTDRALGARVARAAAADAANPARVERFRHLLREAGANGELMAGGTRRPSRWGTLAGMIAPIFSMGLQIAGDMSSGRWQDVPRHFRDGVSMVETAVRRRRGGGGPPQLPSGRPPVAGPPDPPGRREFEWEAVSPAAGSQAIRARALMRQLAAVAAETESEADAEAFIASLVPLAAAARPAIAPALMRSAPRLMSGLAGAMRLLRRRPATRPLIRRLPAVVDRTAATLARRAATGRPITPGLAVRAMTGHTARIVSGGGPPGGVPPAVTSRVRRICLEATRRAARIREQRAGGRPPAALVQQIERSQGPFVDGTVIPLLPRLPRREVDLVVGCMARMEHAAGTPLPFMQRLRAAAAPLVGGIR